jgi:hypothetical protein
MDPEGHARAHCSGHPHGSGLSPGSAAVRWQFRRYHPGRRHRGHHLADLTPEKNHRSKRCFSIEPSHQLIRRSNGRGDCPQITEMQLRPARWFSRPRNFGGLGFRDRFYILTSGNCTLSRIRLFQLLPGHNYDGPFFSASLVSRQRASSVLCDLCLRLSIMFSITGPGVQRRTR